MESISPERRTELVTGARKILKLEFRDRYASDADLFAAYQANDLRTVRSTYERLRAEFKADTENGLIFRRVRVVSAPLSPYQRMAVEWSGYGVEGGEDLRWIPRRLISEVPVPGNECSVLDDETVVFLIFDATDECVETQISQDPATVKFCLETFETLWALATPHHEFKP